MLVQNNPNTPLLINPTHHHQIQCSKQELAEFGLESDIQHTKIIFDVDHSSCSCLSHCIDCCKSGGDRKFILSQKAVITNTHLLIRRERMSGCCCCKKSSEYTRSISLEAIESISTQRGNKLNISYHRTNGYEVYESDFNTLTLFGVVNHREIENILISKRDEHRNKDMSDRTRPLSLNVKRGLIVVNIVIGIITFLVGFFPDVSHILRLNVTVSVIQLDRVMILLAIINELIVLFVMINQYNKTTKNQQIPRSTLQPNLVPNTSLHFIQILLIFTVLIYFIYRCFFIAFYEQNNCAHNLFISSVWYWSILNLILAVHLLQKYHIVKYSRQMKLVIMLQIAIFIILVSFSFYFECIYTNIGGFRHTLYSYCIANASSKIMIKIGIVLLVSYYTGHKIITSYFQIRYSTGIRRAKNDAFNQKLYKTIYTQTKYIVLSDVLMLTLFISLIIYPYNTWVSSFTLTVMSWCICLMHSNNSWLYQICCQYLCYPCLIKKNRINRNRVNFHTLFDEKTSSCRNCKSHVVELQIRNGQNTKQKVLQHSQQSNYNPKCAASSIVECKSVNELLETLNYYHSITMNGNEQQFIQRCQENTLLLDQYIHFFTEHQNIKDINNIFKLLTATNDDIVVCNEINCSFLIRNNRYRTKREITEFQDTEFQFYRNLFDALHCCIYHWRTFTRQINQTVENNMFEEEKCNTDMCKNNKFVIDVQEDSDKVFFTGHRFYYWSYYKNATALTDDDEIEDWFWNKNDHEQLYIAAKYENIKDEILNNTIFPLDLYSFNACSTKTNKYMDSEKIKTMIVRQIFGQNDPLQYGLPNGTPVTSQHILAMVLYCDETDLQGKFSQTFRKTSLHECIAKVMEKNQEFAIWSRLLREMVEYYGHKGFGDVVESAAKNSPLETQNQLTGPFYCGLSSKLAMPEFSIRLCGPTSTSLSQDIAFQFAGNDGLLMRLNNNGTEISGDLRGFPCEWISEYPLEKEVLFMGGEYRIRIETIIIIDPFYNFSLFFKILYLFDCMLNGSVLNGYYLNDIGEKEQMIIDDLIKYKLKTNIFETQINEYVHQTFAAYTNNKQEIVLNYHEIDTNLPSICHFVLYPLQKTKIFNPTNACGKQTIYSDINGRINLFSEVLFVLFTNVRNITIYSSQTEFVEYAFNPLELLQIIHSSHKLNAKNTKIEIKAFHPSWICKRGSFRSDLIQTQFKQNGFKVSYRVKRDIEGQKIDTVTIKKIL